MDIEARLERIERNQLETFHLLEELSAATAQDTDPKPNPEHSETEKAVAALTYERGVRRAVAAEVVRKARFLFERLRADLGR